MNNDKETDQTLKSWLTYNEQKGNAYCFNFFQITENITPADKLVHLLQESILFSYKPKGLYNFHLGETATAEEIRKYVKEQVIPDNKNQLDRNVRQGDWGEILAGLIVTYFKNLVIPINKLQWRFNKNKSVFGTDLIAFNNSTTINDIYYYEIKTRLHPESKEGTGEDRQYISVLAYRSLEKDANSPTESIANFLEMLYFERRDYNTAEKFKDIIINPQNYNRIYEIFLIVEKGNFDTLILDALNNLPPKLSSLNVTIILIENLNNLIVNTWQDIENALVYSICGDTV